MCAMASKLYDCDLTNIAKKSPKITKKQPVLTFLQISQKLFLRIERNFRQSFYIKLVSLKCNDIKLVCLWSDKQQKVAPKKPKKKQFLDFFNFLKNCRYDSN